MSSNSGKPSSSTKGYCGGKGGAVEEDPGVFHLEVRPILQLPTKIPEQNYQNPQVTLRTHRAITMVQAQ